MIEMPELFNNLAGAAALVNGLVLWPIVRSLQKAVNELKDGGMHAVRTTRAGRAVGRGGRGALAAVAKAGSGKGRRGGGKGRGARSR